MRRRRPRSFPSVLAACATITALTGTPAQKQCFATHDDGTLVNNTVTGGVPIGYKLTAPTALRVVALQVHTGLQDGPASLAIYDHDAASNAPRSVVAQGAYTQRGLITWQGAVLQQPVALSAGDVFWVVWTAPDSSRTNWSTDPNGTVFYRGLINGQWNGPPSGWGPRAVKIRVYCEHQTGTTQHYGTGQAGGGGVVPTVTLEGWPSPGNAIELVLQDAAPSAQALLLIGFPTTLTLPGLGTSFVQPLVDALLTTSPGRNPGDGAATLELRAPDDPNLAGIALAFQYWVVDAGATTGFSHTDGLLATFN